MRLYRVVAHLIAAEVVIQAAAIAFAVFGLAHWIDDGGTANKAAFEGGGPDFVGAAGFGIHGVNGMLVIPLLALAFLVISFFTRSVPGAVSWAAVVVVLVAVQMFLGLASHAVVWLGPLHGINAFTLLTAALYAGRRAGSAHSRSERAVVRDKTSVDSTRSRDAQVLRTDHNTG